MASLILIKSVASVKEISAISSPFSTVSFALTTALSTSTYWKLDAADFTSNTICARSSLSPASESASLKLTDRGL